MSKCECPEGSEFYCHWCAHRSIQLEREAIVKWLRTYQHKLGTLTDQGCVIKQAADGIERGEHCGEHLKP